MRKNFVLKAVIFYILSAICSLTILMIVNVAVYWLFAMAGLLDLGSSPLFIAGLAITETSIAVYSVSMISEDILYYNGEYDDTTDVFEEETL